jgi:SAM-dependent methyltransferase
MLDYSIYYRRFHDGSEADFYNNALFYQRLLGEVLASVPHEARILDIGCGQGLLIYALSTFDFKNVQGIDVSKEQIEVARRYGLPCRVVAREHIFDLAKAAPETFDLIFMMDVLEHLEKDEQLKMLAAASDLLAQGGRFILSVPNANASFGLRWRYNDWTHETAFTEHSLEFVLLNSGFTGVNFLPYEFIPRPRMPFIPRKSILPWALQKFFRLFRRLEAVGEMGAQGWKVPLSLNLLAQCVKADAKF